MRFWKQGSLLWMAGVVSCLLVFASPASAETLTGAFPGPVAIPDSGQGSPYPATLNLETADGNITDVNISVTLSHTHPNDIDLAIVSPDGDSEVLMSDACGAPALTGATFTFDGQASSTLPESPCTSGTFRPTNINTSDNWPAPGPGSIASADLNAFTGEDPNGQWKLFVVDDFGGDTGTISSWSVTVTTETAEIVVPGTGTSGVGSAYPSTKNFEVPAGQVISDLDFETPDFSHLHPDDVDMLLAGPRGASTLLMSDACGSTDVHDYQWTFDDEAPAGMADSEIAGCNPFSIRPTNFGDDDSFPAPAPAPPYGSALSAFDGLGSGAWSLFVNDDAGGDTGFITGWTLRMTTRDAADAGFATPSVAVAEGGKARLEVRRSGPAELGPATISVGTEGVASTSSDFSAPATVEFARGESSKTIEIPIAAGIPGEPQETFKVVLSSPRDDARLTFAPTAEVKIAADAPISKFSFGKLKRNSKKGTARLTVNVPGPGAVSLKGKKVKAAKATAAKAGKVTLPVKAKGKALKKLQEKGSVKFTAKVTFTPTGGSALTLPKKLKLVLGG